MNFLIRLLRIALTAVLVIIVAWFVDTYVFYFLYNSLSNFLAIIITYCVTAYLVLPGAIHLGTALFRKNRIPHSTREPDGLSADPVNIILFGTKEELIASFQAAGWEKADALTMKSAWRMGVSFLLNRSYTTAPFSSLYLFGRRQDIGFQEVIGKSPRSRHHIRFWGINSTDSILLNMTDIRYWLQPHKVDPAQPMMWVGAGTKDLGFGFSELTYQLSHKTDTKVDEERDYILEELLAQKAIEDIKRIESGAFVSKKYSSDGYIITARLIEKPEV
jgi:hypothetical protein